MWSLFALTALSIAFYNIVNWWFVSCIEKKPEKFDVLFTFAGEQARENSAMGILESNTDAIWIVSSPLPATRATIDNGIFNGRVIMVDSLKNTLEEARHIIQFCGTKKRIVLLSGPYHMRRIKFLIENLVRKKDCTAHFYYVAVPFNDYNISKFDFFSLYLSELRKIIYYGFYFNFYNKL
jgi:uncharacterized SAM-binding protein YcdF (DUF218 family)